MITNIGLSVYAPTLAFLILIVVLACIFYKPAVRKISVLKAYEIIDKQKPIGLFYTEDNGMFVAIDTTYDETRVETFGTKEDAIKWLRG